MKGVKYVKVQRCGENLEWNSLKFTENIHFLFLLYPLLLHHHLHPVDAWICPHLKSVAYSPGFLYTGYLVRVHLFTVSTYSDVGQVCREIKEKVDVWIHTQNSIFCHPLLFMPETSAKHLPGYWAHLREHVLLAVCLSVNPFPACLLCMQPE